MNFRLDNVAHHCPLSIYYVKRTRGDHVRHNTTHEHRSRVEFNAILRVPTVPRSNNKTTAGSDLGKFT